MSALSTARTAARTIISDAKALVESVTGSMSLRAAQNSLHRLELVTIGSGSSERGVSEARAVAKERTRLALELHDTVAPNLVGIALRLQSIELVYQHLIPEQIRSALMSCHSDARESLINLRQAIAPTLDPGCATLKRSLLRLADAHDRINTGSQLLLAVSDITNLDAEKIHAFERIARESVNNAIRHGHATRIVITVCETSRNALVMTVSDDGCGLGSIRHCRGFGLNGMAERARSIGAILSIASGEAPGTTVTLTLEQHGR